MYRIWVVPTKLLSTGVQADSPVLLRDSDLVRFGEVEADFKLEQQRLTQSNRLVSRPLPTDFQPDPAAEITQSGSVSDLTYGGSEQTFLGLGSEQTFVGGTAGQTFMGGQLKKPSTVPLNNRQSLEQSETALDLDIRVVGKSLRQSASVMPDAAAMVQASATKVTVPTEVARLEGVFLTEGSGRAADQLLSNVRLGLKPGELVALVGPSGSGKTELLQIMAGWRAADRGLVQVLGRQLVTLESNGGVRPKPGKPTATWLAGGFAKWVICRAIPILRLSSPPSNM